MTQKQKYKCIIVLFVVALFSIIVSYQSNNANKDFLMRMRSSAHEKPNLQVMSIAEGKLSTADWKKLVAEFGSEFVKEIYVYEYEVKNTGNASTTHSFWSTLYGVEHDNPNVRCDSSFFDRKGNQNIGFEEMSPGEKYSFVVAIHCPSRNPPGKTITAVTDVKNDIDELDETDNSMTWVDASR